MKAAKPSRAENVVSPKHEAAPALGTTASVIKETCQCDGAKEHERKEKILIPEKPHHHSSEHGEEQNDDRRPR